MKRTLKLISSLFCSLLVVLGLTACGNKTTTAAPTTSGTNNGGVADFDYVNENASATAATSGSVESFVASSYEERAEILALLEQYAMENAISGLVLYDNGGYVKYSSRVQFPTYPKLDSNGNEMKIGETTQYNYITGYGFGIQSEGSLVGTLSGIDANSAYAAYYHTYESEDPKTLNYMNDKGSVVGSYVGYVSSGYFGTKMNETKDGYVWYASTATDVNKVGDEFRPMPLKDGQLDTTATAKTLAANYRIYVKVGSELTYATDTKNANLTKYNGREVALEDYIVSYKELFNQSNGLARGSENLEGAAALKGMAAYYDATAEGYDDAAWQNVGVKTGTDATGSYIDFEFVTPCTPFYAMYYLSSSLHAPIPADFLTDIGGIKNWGSFNSDNTLTPVDTTLSTGVYVVEAWNEGQEFIFKKNTSINPSVYGGEGCYNIAGLHVDILEAVTKDPLAAFKEYQAGKLDGCGIPKDLLKEELGTPGTQMTAGSSSTKLNVNTCTDERWAELFGVNGTITQTAEEDYWDCEPAMSNPKFIQGLSWAIDRQTFASNLGATPSIEYFTNNYLSDPEAGVSYNATEAHKKAMEAVYGKTWADTYGYDLEKAMDLFAECCEQWLADGTYKAGDVIEIEIAWMSESSIKTSGEPIAKYLEDAFNDESVCDGQLTLKINNMFVEVWSDVYYSKMMVGQFDIAIGGISGNTLNPLNFMEVLKSDNSSGFTLNWGPDTNGEACIEYKGNSYTYDALWKAADTGAFISEGKLCPTHDADLYKNVANEDGTRTVVIKFAATNVAACKVTVEDVVVCWYDGAYKEESVLEVANVNYETGEITITISAELAAAYPGNVGFDIYYNVALEGLDAVTEYDSLYALFPYAE